jgi:flagellar biosynthetic protein FlhB
MQDSRRRGHVARSQDLTAAVPLFVGFVALAVFGERIFLSLEQLVRVTVYGADSDLEALWPVAGATISEVLRHSAWFFGVLTVAILLTLIVQVGFVFSVEPLRPKLGKISPLQGIQRLFSMRALMLGLISLGKLVLVSALVYAAVRYYAAEITHAFILGFPELIALGGRLAFRFCMIVVCALIVMALLDFAWQRYRHFRDLHMTKEEVKDELRGMEGDPRIKRRRRDVQMQLYVQRLRREVPKADVIVANPTHFAVAIAYDADSMPAPKVVAKGADWMAIRIRQIAQEHEIPIVERPPLARALYAAVDVGDYVPERLYRAIAEILAYVYELTGRDPMRRRGSSAA